MLDGELPKSGGGSEASSLPDVEEDPRGVDGGGMVPERGGDPSSWLSNSIGRRPHHLGDGVVGSGELSGTTTCKVAKKGSATA